MSGISNLELLISKEINLDHVIDFKSSESEKSHEPLFKSKTRQEGCRQRQTSAFRQGCEARRHD